MRTRHKMHRMSFPESTFAAVESELGPLHEARWHHALAVVLTVAAIAIGWAIGG